MRNNIVGISLIYAATAGLLPSQSALAANSGVLAITVTVAEKCRIDFSESSADFFQVCSAAQGVSNERASNVLGAAIAIDPAADPFHLDGEPGTGTQPAAPNRAPGTAAPPPAARRAHKVVQIQY